MAKQTDFQSHYHGPKRRPRFTGLSAFSTASSTNGSLPQEFPKVNAEFLVIPYDRRLLDCLSRQTCKIITLFCNGLCHRRFFCVLPKPRLRTWSRLRTRPRLRTWLRLWSRLRLMPRSGLQDRLQRVLERIRETKWQVFDFGATISERTREGGGHDARHDRGTEQWAWRMLACCLLRIHANFNRS